MVLNKALKNLEGGVPNYASLAVRSIFQIWVIVCRDVYRSSHISRSNVVFPSCTSLFFFHLEPIIRFSAVGKNPAVVPINLDSHVRVFTAPGQLTIFPLQSLPVVFDDPFDWTIWGSFSLFFLF